MKRIIVFVAILSLAGLALASMELSSARLYKKQGEWLKSYQFYNQAAEKEPDNQDVYFERGQLLHDIAIDSTKADLAKQIAAGKPDPQLELYSRMLEDFKTAQISKKKGDEGKIKDLKKKIDVVLENSWTHFYFEALQSDTNYIKASENKDPNAKQFLTQAIHDLDVAIMLVPERWNAYGFKAQIFTKLDSTAASAENWKLAIKAIEAADKTKRETPEYVQGLAIAREALLIDNYNLGRDADVLSSADEILKGDPANVNAIQLKANTLAKLASDTSLTVTKRDSLKSVAVTALAGAAKAVTDTSALADIEYTIGQFKLQVADTVGAVEALNEALKYRADDRDVLFALGVIYLEGGSLTNTEKARDMFKKITELYPDHSPSWINYGVALIRLGKTEEGKKVIQKGKELAGGK